MLNSIKITFAFVFLLASGVAKGQSQNYEELTNSYLYDFSARRIPISNQILILGWSKYEVPNSVNRVILTANGHTIDNVSISGGGKGELDASFLTPNVIPGFITMFDPLTGQDISIPVASVYVEQVGTPNVLGEIPIPDELKAICGPGKAHFFIENPFNINSDVTIEIRASAIWENNTNINGVVQIEYKNQETGNWFSLGATRPSMKQMGGLFSRDKSIKGEPESILNYIVQGFGTSEIEVRIKHVHNGKEVMSPSMKIPIVNGPTIPSA